MRSLETASGARFAHVADLYGSVFVLVELAPAAPRRIVVAVISLDELDHHFGTTIVVPLTTGRHPYPYRVPCRFGGKSGYIVTDQLRTVDHERLRKRLGSVSTTTLHGVLQVLDELFEV